MNLIIGILIGILCLMLLVSAHEFGHFIMAKRSGVRVLEYGLCFPPRAVAWVHTPVTDKNGKPVLKKNGKPAYKWIKIPKEDWGKPQDHLIFSINFLPIGGFCQMDGESDADDRKGTFGASSFWSKTKILFGGVAVNWIIAILVFTILAWIGMPIFMTNQFTISDDERIEYEYVTVEEVVENSPAERAGFMAGDQIVSINGQKVYDAYAEEFSSYAGEDVTYEIIRTTSDSCATENTTCDNATSENLTLTAHLNDSDNEWGYLLGVSMSSDYVYKYYTWSAPLIGIGTTAQITKETFVGLGQMLWNLGKGLVSQFSTSAETREAGQASISAAGDSVTGPVGIVGVLFPLVAKSGIKNTFFVFALISVSLACMNVLPIPALDGGRWFMIAIARLKHTRLSKETEEKIVARAMIVLLGIMALVTVLDIIRFF